MNEPIEAGRRPRDASAMIGADPAAPPAKAPFDPLRLCVYTTVALLGWLLGPWAVLVFAALAFRAYAVARRGGLRRSDCLLRDTRLVLAYLGLVALGAVAWIGYALTHGGWR